jgi:hypothetical protein
MRKTILFISTNDGSDTRINKEIKTLSGVFDVIFLGVGNYGENNFCKKYCKEFLLIQGKRNRWDTIIKQVLICSKIVLFKKIHSVHIINEQLFVFFYPFLFFKHVVLDIFDSIFLKLDKPNNKCNFLKRLVYSPANKIIVTDENRFENMPDFSKPKLIILENYPYFVYSEVVKPEAQLIILYFGLLNIQRGTSFLKNLIIKYQNVNIKMAGWIKDEPTQELVKMKQVDYLGILTQKEAAKISAHNCHYILCMYEPCNQNNINASPNKIYDAIQTRTPVIINSEVKISEFVKEKNLGVVINSFYDYDIDDVYQLLITKKKQFDFNDSSRKQYSWEFIESKLIKAHSR